MNMEYTLSGDEKRLVGGGGRGGGGNVSHTSVKYLSPAMILPPPFHRHDGGQFEGHYESCVGHC